MKHALTSIATPASVAAGMMRAVRTNPVASAARRHLRSMLIHPTLAALNFQRHRELQRILSVPHLQSLTARHPRISGKYASGCYLARGFSASERLEILIHHYARCAAFAAPCLIEEIVERRFTLWHEVREDHRFAIYLSFPYSLHHAGRTVDYEGDLSLVFEIDGNPAYIACFTLCPLRLVTCKDEQESCFFVGRIQGVHGRFETIRKATRLLHDITPRDLLIVALQGLAHAFGVTAIAGVGTRRQVSAEGREDEFFDYDRFWTDVGAQPAARGSYLLRLPVAEKPIETIAQRHRSRTLKKRHYKHGVAQTVETAFRNHFTGVSSIPSPTHDGSSRPAGNAIGMRIIDALSRSG